MRTLFLFTVFSIFSLQLGAQASNVAPWTNNSGEWVCFVPGVVSFSASPDACTQVSTGALLTILTLADGSTLEVVAPDDGNICYGEKDESKPNPDCEGRERGVDEEGNFTITIHPGGGSGCPGGGSSGGNGGGTIGPPDGGWGFD